MLGIKTFRNSFNQLLANKADYFFLFYHFLMFTGRIRQINISDNTNLVIYLIVTILYSLFMKKLRINIQALYILFIFFIISLPSLILFEYSFVTYIGLIIRLLIAYIIINYFKTKLIFYFENLMFLLAYISIPLYIVQIFYPQFYHIFTPFTKVILPAVYAESSSSNEFQYLLVFGVNGWATLRNSGMFSEPSVYASMLAWAMIINLSINKYKDNKRLAVFFITSITLFSLGMIIYLIPISLIYIINNIGKKYLIYLLRTAFIIAVSFLFLMKTTLFMENYEMMSKKIQIEKTNREMVEKGSLSQHELSRVTGAIKNLEYFSKWPFGYGFFRSETDYFKYLGTSPNGLAVQLVNWGIAFIIILSISAYRFSRILQFYSQKRSVITLILVMITFILPISGTSLTNDPLYLSILLWPIIIYRSFKYLESKTLHLYYC